MQKDLILDAATQSRVFGFYFYIRPLFHQFVGQANDFGGELFALRFYDGIIDGVSRPGQPSGAWAGDGTSERRGWSHQR